MEKTDREIRRKLIKKAIKPFEKCSFKIPAIKEPIYISKDSISEIAHRASNSYKSTLLAINIEEVVFNIKKRVRTSRPKQNNTQTRTFKLTEMYEYLSVSRGGKAKVMIGRQTNKNLILYSITAK